MRSAVQVNRNEPRAHGRNLLLTLPFLLLFLLQLVHHAPWRDELNAFGIAVASPTLSRLFALIHYEGHPWLWYFLLYLVSKFTVYPVGMKALEGVLGCCSLLMIGLRSPFTTAVKLLLFLSYFVTFEYTVMSRMYSLLLLLLLVYLSERSRHPHRALLNGALLGLMASTDSMGILLSGGLAVEYAWWLLEKKDRRAFGVAAATYLVLLAGSFASLRLSPDISWRTTGHPLSTLHHWHDLVWVAVSYVAMPYLPVMTLHLGPFWNPLPWDAPLLTLPLFVLVCATYAWTFRRDRRLLVMVALVAIGATVFGYCVYQGVMRHYGVTFLAFLAGLWLLKVERGRLPSPALVLLGLCAVGGVLVNVEEWRRPWSNSSATAQWLTVNGLADRPIAGAADTSVASLAELMHRSTYQLDCNCADTFLLFSRRRDGFSRDQIPERLALARQRLGPAMLYIGDERLQPHQQTRLQQLGLAPTLIRSFEGAEAGHENYFVYTLGPGSNGDVTTTPATQK